MTTLVALDAGHGMYTAGKRTPDDEREWSFNTVVIESILKNLQNYERVQTIRLDDPTGETDVPLKTRTNKANQAQANILISYHHNASTGQWGDWTGTETYHYPGSTKGKALATVIHPYVVNAYGLKDRGIKSANFHMLRESRMPAILIEGGFMDSTIDINKMRNKQVLQKAGKNITQGIAKHLRLKKKTGKDVNMSTGKLYKVQIGAFHKKYYAQELANKAKNMGLEVYISEEEVTNTNKSNAKQTYDIGDKVNIKANARTYVTGEVIPNWVKKQTHTIQQMKGDRVLLEEIYSWVNKGDLK